VRFALANVQSCMSAIKENTAGGKTAGASLGVVLFAMSFYMIVSIALVFANKFVLNDAQMDAPIFLTWTQVVIAVICCAVLAFLKKYVAVLSFFPDFEYDRTRAKAVMPLSLIFVGMVLFNNLCLKYVEVSFYQIARSLTILCQIVLTYFMLGKTTSTTAIAGCGIVVLGFVIGTIAEVGAITASIQGVIFGVMSSVFVALYAVYVKKALPAVNDNTWLLMIYNNINASIVMPVCYLLLGEFTPITTSPAVFTADFWMVILIAGLLGFLINIATFLQIQVTSPLTHNVIGTFKACVQTVFAVVYYQNITTIWFWLGFLLTVAGSALYTFARMNDG